MTVAVIEAKEANALLTAQSATYALAHDDLVGATTGDLEGGTGPGQHYDPAGGDWYAVYRAGLIFDTSAVPTGAVITAATLSLYGMTEYADTGFNLTVVTGSDLNDPMVDADFGDLLNDTTSFGAFTISAGGAEWLIQNWNVITINATGLAAIQTMVAASLVKLGLRSSRDISSTTPKLNGTENIEFVEMYGVLTANKKPKLTLTYASGEGQGVLRVKGEYLDYLSRTGATRRAYGLAAPAGHIADPSGGGTQDAEARTAINAILVALENAKIVADA